MQYHLSLKVNKLHSRMYSPYVFLFGYFKPVIHKVSHIGIYDLPLNIVCKIGHDKIIKYYKFCWPLFEVKRTLEIFFSFLQPTCLYWEIWLTHFVPWQVWAIYCNQAWSSHRETLSSEMPCIWCSFPRTVKGIDVKPVVDSQPLTR